MLHRYTKILFVMLSLLIEPCLGLDEFFDSYQSGSCLAQGNACTASVSGYASHFYNPAALSRFRKKNSEIHLVVGEAHMNQEFANTLSTARDPDLANLLTPLQNRPGKYQFLSVSTLPAITFRNFSFAILGSYQVAALSGDTTLDIDARQEIIPSLGFSHQFAGNILRLGVSLKAVYLNQMKGVYQHTDLNSMNDDNLGTLIREGAGLRADTGLLLVLPHRFLPTFGISWMNMFDTVFRATRFLNTQSPGAPDKISQSFSAGFSISPQFDRNWSSTVSVDYKHLELSAIPWKKHFHVGLELQNNRTFFFWGGLNQMYLTGGLGARIKGGHLEAGTYAKEIGEGSNFLEDRRYFLRYTLSF